MLGFSAREVAATLDASPPSIDTALQRARRTVQERLPAQSQQATLRALGDDRLRAVVGKFVDAWERADVDAVVGLLAQDVQLAMPPVPTWFRGRADVAVFLARRPLRTTSRLLATQANGQPAFGNYGWDDARQAFVANDLIILTLAGPQIADITAFLSPGLLADFGLPERI